MRICKIDGCDQGVGARGWCGMHYKRWLRHGDTGSAHNPARRWTVKEDELIREWYSGRTTRKLESGKLIDLLGRSRSAVFLRASRLGVGQRVRKTGRKPTPPPKHASVEGRNAAIGRATREWIAENGHPRGALGLKHTPEHLEKMHRGAKKAMDAMKADPAQMKAWVDKSQATKMRRHGTLGPGLTSTQTYSRTKKGRRADLNDQYFRSSWEANYARYLNLLISTNIIEKWEYEATTFWFEAIKRGVRSYTPDFLVTRPNGSTYQVEVKGWMDQKSRTKLKRIKKYYPDVELVLVDQKVYKEIEKKLGGAIPYWEYPKAAA